MKIGYFTWEPGMSEQGKYAKTAAGGAVWTRYLFDRLRHEGHSILWYGGGFVPGCSHRTFLDSEKPDVLFLVWRWPMPNRPEREILHHRMMNLILEASALGVRTIIHDEDHKMSLSDIDLMQKLNVILTAPELNPRRGFKMLMFPDPFFALPTPNATPSYRIPIYIGNNYERYDQAVKYFSGVKSVMYGDWNERKEGQDPDKIASDLPHAEFPGRLAQDNVLSTLSSHSHTVHLAKQSYCERGFVTIRWAEAACAGTPAIVPYEFELGLYEPDLAICRPAQDTHEAINAMHHEISRNGYLRSTVFKAQSDFVKETMRFEPWLKILTA